MPLYWIIDSRARLMTAVAEGGVTKAEAIAYLDVMVASGACGYRRLFNGSRGEPAMEASDIMELAVRMRTMQQHGPIGPLAIVMPRDKYGPFARMLGILSVPERPLRVFIDAAAAQAWLDEPAVRDWSAS
jgi:hypothetical protein